MKFETFFCCLPGVRVHLFAMHDLRPHALLMHPELPALMVNLTTGKAVELRGDLLELQPGTP